MKKIICISLCFLCLAGCAESESKNNTSDKENCATTLLPIWNGKATMLMPITNCY